MGTAEIGEGLTAPWKANYEAMNTGPDMMQQCIADCQNCHSVCLKMASTHCLEMGGKHVEPHHLRTMMDCVQICQTAADFMLRQSALHAYVCEACATICEECARSCEETGDMQECVDACRRCAESCEQMASMVSHGGMENEDGEANSENHMSDDGVARLVADLETADEQDTAEPTRSTIK